MNIYIKALIAPVVFGVVSCGALADSDEREESGWGFWKQMRQDVASVDNTLYAEECGVCHMAYQPGLLPRRSWKAVMTTLEDHFGEDASLDREVVDELTDYLNQNAADVSDYKRSKSFAGVDGAPRRISDSRYFRRKHHELSEKMVVGNPDVGSWSNCTACHTKAEQGSYDEDQIDIPGYRHWDD